LVKELNKYNYQHVDHEELPVFYIRSGITKECIKKPIMEAPKKVDLH
jgi:hypothetical protein